jgi:hypothetical protein
MASKKKKKLSIHIENAPTIVKSRSTRYKESEIYVCTLSTDLILVCDFVMKLNPKKST